MDKAKDYLANTYPGWIAVVIFVAMSLVCAIWSGEGHEEYNLTYNNGDIAWMVTSCCLVLLMTPGLAFFYGGLVQEKNIITCLFQSYAAIMVITVLWVWFVCSLAFGDDVGNSGIYGNIGTYFMFKNVGSNDSMTGPDGPIPNSLFAMFQLKFAIITPALISGAFAERINFKAYLLFISLFCIFIYAPACHMEWGDNGLLGTQWGVLDFAGGTVVHMSSGYAALAGAYYLGPSEVHKNKERKQPANVPLMMLGTAMLLVGWFGFNAGSELAANSSTAQVLVNTHVAAATGMFGWTIMEYLRQNKLSASGFCIGCVAGLVGITPACGYVSTGASLWIGFITAIVANISSHFMQSLEGIEDTLDVFSCHGVGGTVGLLLTGLFANFGGGVGEDGVGLGAFYGNGTLFGYCIATICMMGPAFFLMALLLLKITDMICPVRVSEDVEKAGLDISHHGETLPGVELITDTKVSTIAVSVKDPTENI